MEGGEWRLASGVVVTLTEMREGRADLRLDVTIQTPIVAVPPLVAAAVAVEVQRQQA